MFESGIVTSMFDAKYWQGAAPFREYKEENIIVR